MKTLELFAGTQSFSKVARELGYETYCIDSDSQFDNNWTLNLLNIGSYAEITIKQMIDNSDIVWMSPPCTTFSMASGNKHWNADQSPKTLEAKKGKELLDLCLKLARHCIRKKKIFFIENPRARARWFLPKKWRKTAWYCQYGDSRAKPTDIWTNLENWNPKTCKNGNKECHHEPAPRGSKTGTQGLKGSIDRSVIPPKLFHEIFDACSVQEESNGP